MSVISEGPVAIMPPMDDAERESAADVDLMEPEPEDSTVSDGSGLGMHPHFFHPDDTIIIFDWDDTLLPSSFITQEELRLDGPLEVSYEVEEELRQLGEIVRATLTLAANYGTVYIITNAETGWVELSCAKFLPDVTDALRNVTVISARSTYEPTYPKSPFNWKYAAFSEEIGTYFDLKKRKDTVKNVLSLGDSIHERDAVHLVTGRMDNVRTKSVKFVDRPTIDELRRQVEMVHSCFAQLSHYDGDLDMMLTLSVLEK